MTYDEWLAYMAMAQQAYSLYQIWPQMGLIMWHDFSMGFDLYNTGFEPGLQWGYDDYGRAAEQEYQYFKAMGGGSAAAQLNREEKKIADVVSKGLADINKTSKEKDIEQGGFIYDKNGKYYLTPAVTDNNAHSVQILPALKYVPLGSKVVGYYHTHGAESEGHLDEQFGVGDVKASDYYAAKYSSWIGCFVGTPSDSVYFYRAGSVNLANTPIGNQRVSAIQNAQIYVGKIEYR
jgi:hypothetical protein